MNPPGPLRLSCIPASITIVMPDYEDNQHGTVHFHYLLNAGGGLLSSSNGMDAHRAQLSAALSSPQSGVRPFVREFVRPLGLDRAATPVFVEAVESMQNMPVETPARDALVPVWRWMLQRVAGMRDNDAYDTWTLSPREHASAEHARRMREQKAIRRAMGRAAKDAERLRKLKERAERFS